MRDFEIANFFLLKKRYKELRNTLQILIILFFLIGCTDSKNDVQKLESGIFYLNTELSSDTLFFQSKKPKSIIRNWNRTVWKITEDSIFQDDSRGLSYFLGKDKCSYSLNYYTLIVTYKSSLGSRNNRNIKKKVYIDKYVVLKSDKDFLQLIDLESKAMDSKIRTDIQLR